MTVSEKLDSPVEPVFHCRMCDGGKRVLAILFNAETVELDEKRRDVIVCPACGGTGLASENEQPTYHSFYIEDNFLPALLAGR